MNSLFAGSAMTLMFFVSAGAQAQDTPEALQRAFVAAVEAEDATALGNLFTADADSYSPGTHHVRGREAIAADWQGFFDAFDNISLTLDMHGSAGLGDLAWMARTAPQMPN